MTRPSSPLEGSTVEQISCGGYHTVALCEGGLFTWGHGANGRLGRAKGEDQLVPGRVPSSNVQSGVVEIACGEHHTALRKADGRVFTWGRGAFGRLGHGDEADVNTPREVEALSGLEASQIACGVYHTLVVTDGGVYLWGTESAGHAPAKADLLPAMVPNSDAWKVHQIASGGFHLAAVVSGDWSPSKRGVAGEDAGAPSVAVAKMLNTVTSAETRRKLRDALARHGASMSQSLRNSVHSSPNVITSSVSHEAGSAGMAEVGASPVSSQALHEALEVARSAYQRRKDREESQSSRDSSQGAGSGRPRREDSESRSVVSFQSAAAGGERSSSCHTERTK